MRQAKEWLIVTRSGQNGDRLSVADGGGITTVPDLAPVDGYARIYTEDGVIKIEASGRHAHSQGENDGREVLHDVPHPAPGDGMSWHFNAFRLPWSGEMTS